MLVNDFSGRNIITYNQCGTIWNKTAVVTAILLVVKKELCRFNRMVERKSDNFRDYRFDLGI